MTQNKTQIASLDANTCVRIESPGFKGVWSVGGTNPLTGSTWVSGPEGQKGALSGSTLVEVVETASTVRFRASRARARANRAAEQATVTQFCGCEIDRAIEESRMRKRGWI